VYGDIAARAIGVNGRTMDGQPKTTIPLVPIGGSGGIEIFVKLYTKPNHSQDKSLSSGWPRFLYIKV